MLQTSLGLGKDEASNVLQQVSAFEAMWEKGRSRVKFANTLLPPTSFLHCFSSRCHASEVEAGKPTATITISREIAEERRQALGETEGWVDYLGLYATLATGTISPPETRAETGPGRMYSVLPWIVG